MTGRVSGLASLLAQSPQSASEAGSIGTLSGSRMIPSPSLLLLLKVKHSSSQNWSFNVCFFIIISVTNDPEILSITSEGGARESQQSRLGRNKISQQAPPPLPPSLKSNLYEGAS